MEGKKKKKGEPGREREALMCKVEEKTEVEEGGIRVSKKRKQSRIRE